MRDTSHILRGYTLMKGNTLAEFINDLLTMGGPEKEFEFRGKKYMTPLAKDDPAKHGG